MPVSKKGIKDFLWPVWITVRRAATFRHGEIILFKHDHDRSYPVNSLLDVRRVSPGNVTNVSTMDTPATVALFRDFLELGDWGYYACLDGRVVHRSWVKFPPQSVATWYRYAPFQLRGGQAFIHYCRTSETAKGKGIYPTVLSKIAADCYTSGVKEVWTATTADNHASQRGIEKAGFVEVERKRVRVFFGLPVYRPGSTWSAQKSA